MSFELPAVQMPAIERSSSLIEVNGLAAPWPS
jgi:hypothetical protein